MGVSLFSPAKINLFLAVTGRRPDGFHDLVSVVAPLDFGDQLSADRREPGAGADHVLACSDPALPVDGTNLVLRAARVFAEATGWREPVAFDLVKRIPAGAGLGGGSSNSVAALRALQRLSGCSVTDRDLAAMAAQLGSDCALFLAGAPVVMRGRGERIERLDEPAAARLRGRSVLLFKPGFAISTPWAYGRMAAGAPQTYLPAAEAEARLAQWRNGTAPVTELLFNNMETAAFEKFVALPVLLAHLRREFGVAPRMSGSGSACFILWDEARPDAELVARISRRIRDCWGEAAFVQAARLA